MCRIIKTAGMLADVHCFVLRFLLSALPVDFVTFFCTYFEPLYTASPRPQEMYSSERAIDVPQSIIN
jgi:hypothetical protein